MYKGDGDFLLKWDPEKTKELYFSLVIHTHTHTDDADSTHARTGAHKATDDQRSQHLLRNAECTRGHTPHTPTQPATRFIHGHHNGQLQACRTQARTQPQSSQRRRHTHGSTRQDTFNPTPPASSCWHQLQPCGARSTLVGPLDPAPGTARRSLPLYLKHPPPHRSQAQPESPHHRPPGGRSRCRTSQLG